MLLTKEVTMNLSYREPPIIVDVLQGDSGRALVIHLIEGDTPWSIPADASIVVQYCCADGTGGTFDSMPDGTPAYAADEDTLTVLLASPMCAVAGCTKVQVTILAGGNQISTFPIELRVQAQVDGQIADGSYSNLHQWLRQPENMENIVAAVLTALPKGDEVSY